ncbi:MAG: hypothetical protein ORN21_07040 [Methylophilaceae bacterium]|nr:hypothetical protein [Methylophilaceae bacterium]
MKKYLLCLLFIYQTSYADLSSFLGLQPKDKDVTKGGGDWLCPKSTKKDFRKVGRELKDYEAEGNRWGKRHSDEKRKAQTEDGDAQIDWNFVYSLVAKDGLDYFSVHSDLKEAFKKGYRTGYQDRTADLVLGPHLSAAGSCLGYITASGFVKTIEDFEYGWADWIRKAVDVFITLINEGSQNDREQFVNKFTSIYEEKYNKNSQLTKGANKLITRADGGTLLYLDYSKGKTLGVLDVPAATALKTELYDKAFTVMGDELGRRLASNLIKRDELIDLLRRSKTAMQETPVNQSVNTRLSRNMTIFYNSFVLSYGTDAGNVLSAIIREAGYSDLKLN